ncbi:bifunctional alpha,alpha-trehalose-phosphate synthase (UDP-forming)/trehalose-phosphatase [Polluticoccus soli]|uniref:bifunctional alpha,alpha-trehalose-phosphate synthase (UDP-forming)/trehalose-phosphatase n=1 Tax=Polluticoccus soli TaxID=3034150 RepID=UPI0023E14DC1|nr:bifunctional alpha,alpha-trehalose-phosphate synthase (UDP-forming)/trehalose-phosphatase [Flavipsychrobacter sp. JY13-12]
MQKRLFIVSNRLPVNIQNDEQISVSSGGLVSAISSYLNGNKNNIVDVTEKIWVGAPECSFGTWAKLEDKIPESGYTYKPVFIGKKVYESYYNGLSNSMIWPLFHYFPSYAEYKDLHFEAYIQANRAFADVLATHLHPNDIVWIHDYHLLPLAEMLREQFPELTIGFFLHIPFPSFEIFRIMPRAWQKALIKGMLGADLIGFHTIDYAGHFLKSVQMILGLSNDMHTIRYNSRLVKVDIFPISIDFEKFHESYSAKSIVERRNVLKEQFQSRKIIFSVDRLDYTKGVSSRLRAYEQFLSDFPEFREKVVFVMVVVPSRDTISKYAERKKMIDEYIGDLNSRIGNINWQPVIYQYNNLDFSELLALYTACDLALITPLRDGMNLVAKEFVASRKDKCGVLILSEMAGAARELTDSLIINPNDTAEIAQKIKQGLELSKEQQSRRITNMQSRLREYDVRTWAADFIEQLLNVKNKQNDFEIKFLDSNSKIELVSSFQSATRRLLLLDYDGTLMQLKSHPLAAEPTKNILEILSTLGSDKRNDVNIISGRDSRTLDQWLGDLPVNIISEHGASFKLNGGTWVREPSISDEWLEPIQAVMISYAKRCVNSFVEVKDFSVAWHYRNADEEQGTVRATELFSELLDYTNNLNIQVIRGHKVIEVRNKGINKGTAVKRLLNNIKCDFVLACGDDTTDEDMFAILARDSRAFTIKVGSEASYAKYNLHTPHMVLSMLEMLSGTALANLAI